MKTLLATIALAAMAFAAQAQDKVTFLTSWYAQLKPLDNWKQAYTLQFVKDLKVMP